MIKKPLVHYSGRTSEMSGDDILEAQNVVIKCKNIQGSTLNKFTPVMFAGTDGVSGHISVVKMDGSGTPDPKYYLGITGEAISNGEYGNVITFGTLDEINTSNFSNGDILWIANDIPGTFVSAKPSGLALAVAAVITSHAVNGKVVIRSTQLDENAITGGSTGDYNVDGGAPDSIYLATQNIDGGSP